MVIKQDFEKSELNSKYIFSEKALFFDIETTGLSYAHTHITIIGAGYTENNTFRLVQFFLENPSDEKQLLIEFSDFLSRFDKIIHFNGSTFDVPYIRNKCLNYELSDPFEGKECNDLYRIAGKFDRLLGLDGLKQKAIEAKCGIKRKDTISGKECIDVYEQYILTGDVTFKNTLLLHNADDVVGLYKIQAFYAYALLLETDNLVIINESVSNEAPAPNGTFHLIDFETKAPLPLPIITSGANYSLKIINNKGFLAIKGSKCELGYYFKNYKDYFYLPNEHKAIHKSVGIYVDKAHRKKATRENCCERKTGIFFPQPRAVVTPAFQAEYNSKLTWYELKKAGHLSDNQLKYLIESVIKYAMKASKSSKIPFEF